VGSELVRIRWELKEKGLEIREARIRFYYNVAIYWLPASRWSPSLQLLIESFLSSSRLINSC